MYYRLHVMDSLTKWVKPTRGCDELAYEIKLWLKDLHIFEMLYCPQK